MSAESSTSQKPTEDPYQCHWKESGTRCSARGSVSPGLHGKGPRFCAEHYERMIGRRPLPNQIELEVDPKVNQMVPREPDESMHQWSMRCRQHVLSLAGVKHKRQREPGEDDE